MVGDVPRQGLGSSKRTTSTVEDPAAAESWVGEPSLAPWRRRRPDARAARPSATRTILRRCTGRHEREASPEIDDGEPTDRPKAVQRGLDHSHVRWADATGDSQHSHRPLAGQRLDEGGSIEVAAHPSPGLAQRSPGRCSRHAVTSSPPPREVAIDARDGPGARARPGQQVPPRASGAESARGAKDADHASAGMGVQRGLDRGFGRAPCQPRPCGQRRRRGPSC